MFNTPTFSLILNTSSFCSFNIFPSTYSLCLCWSFCVSFSLTNLCNFSIAFFALIFLWTLELQKNTQPHVANKNNLQHLLCVCLSFSFHPVVFLVTCRLLINVSSLKLWRSIIVTFCVCCTTMWKHVTEHHCEMNVLDFIFWLFCICSPPRLIILTLCRSLYTSYVEYANTSINCVDTSIKSVGTTNIPTWNFEITYSSFYTS
jgi:hypothetical protein